MPVNPNPAQLIAAALQDVAAAIRESRAPLDLKPGRLVVGGPPPRPEERTEESYLREDVRDLKAALAAEEAAHTLHIEEYGKGRANALAQARAKAIEEAALAADAFAELAGQAIKRTDSYGGDGRATYGDIYGTAIEVAAAIRALAPAQEEPPCHCAPEREEPSSRCPRHGSAPAQKGGGDA